MNLISYDKNDLASFDLSNFDLWRLKEFYYLLFALFMLLVLLILLLFILLICYAFCFYLYNNARSSDISPRHVIYLPFNPMIITTN